MRRIIGISAGVSVLIGLLITAFVWPSSQIEPRDVPLVVAGPAPAVAEVESQLDEVAPGAFDVEAVADEDAAQRAIVDEEAYGAVVLEASGPPRMLTATAASPAVASMLQGVAERMAAQGEATANVEDVVPLPAEDARGTGFNSGAMPMVIAGLAAGLVMALTVTGVRSRFYGATMAAVGGGVAAALIMHSWLGVLGGDWWAAAGVFTLTIAALSFTVVGLHALLGHPGLGLAALVLMLLGNPLSGVTSAPELLPSGWGELGQALPPGAGGSLLRSVSYFDGAAAGGPIVVLSLWILGAILAGAAGAAVTKRFSGRHVPVSDATTNPAVPTTH